MLFITELRFLACLIFAVRAYINQMSEKDLNAISLSWHLTFFICHDMTISSLNKLYLSIFSHSLSHTLVSLGIAMSFMVMVFFYFINCHNIWFSGFCQLITLYCEIPQNFEISEVFSTNDRPNETRLQAKRYFKRDSKAALRWVHVQSSIMGR